MGNEQEALKNGIRRGRFHYKIISERKEFFYENEKENYSDLL